MPSPLQWTRHFANRLAKRHGLVMTTDIRDEILRQLLAAALPRRAPHLVAARFIQEDTPTRFLWEVQLEGRAIVVVLELAPLPALITALPREGIRHG